MTSKYDLCSGSAQWPWPLAQWPSHNLMTLTFNTYDHLPNDLKIYLLDRWLQNMSIDRDLNLDICLDLDINLDLDLDIDLNFDLNLVLNFAWLFSKLFNYMTLHHLNRSAASQRPWPLTLWPLTLTLTTITHQHYILQYTTLHITTHNIANINTHHML
jgi:hypothetical protein